MQIFKALDFISSYIQLLPLTLLLIYRPFNAQLKALFLYCFISAAIEVFITFIPDMNVVSHFTLMNSYTILETLIIYYIYYREFKFERSRFMIILNLVFILVAIGNYSNKQYSDITSGAEGLTIIALAIIYFYRISGDLSIPKLTNYYFFWINASFLFYFSITSLFFLAVNYIRFLTGMEYKYLWALNHITNILYNILLSIGIIKARQLREQPKQVLSSESGLS